MVIDMSESLQQRCFALRRKVLEKQFLRMNDRQREAVFQTQGPLLILAGAGSGKTTVLVNRIANLIQHGDAYHSEWFDPSLEDADEALLRAALAGETDASQSPRLDRLLSVCPARPWEILAITFTNKAAGELKDRLAAMLGEEGRDIWATTFHSSCARILRRWGDRLGYTAHFTIYDTDDSRRLMKECQKELSMDDKLFPHRSILSAISRAKDSLIGPAQFLKEAGGDSRLKRYGEAYLLYQRRLKEADAMDFDDLIVQTVRLFEEQEDVLEYYQNKFQYIMVDEYQDTNHAQYVLTSLLARKNRNLCVVGDDNQSIYRFRGATIENILTFEKQYDEATVVRLEQNYRSTQNILDAANAVIRNNKVQKEKNLWTQNGEGSQIEVYTADDEDGEAAHVADSILEHVKNGARYADHAILYRMNAQSNALERTFVRVGIPYRIIGGVKFYDRKEVKDVLAYLCVISNPADTLRLRRIINEPKRGIGTATVNRAAEIADQLGVSMFEVISHADEYGDLQRSARKLMEFASTMRSLMRAADEMPPHELLELTLDRSGYLLSLQAQGEEGAERVENVNELSSSIIQYEQEEDEPSLAGFLENIQLMTDIDNFNTDADTVVMMTIHSAKGLEFPNVFLVGMEEGIFPGNQSIYAGEAEMEEERRLAYVGITRAKNTLALSHATTRLLFGQTNRNRPSRFLGEIPSSLTHTSGSLGRRAASGWGDSFGGSGFGARSAAGKSDFGGRSAGFSSASGASKPGFRRPASAGVAAQTPAAQTVYRPGDRVGHKAFGEGMVVEAVNMGNDTLLTIAFDKVGTKKLMANFARLTKVEA